MTASVVRVAPAESRIVPAIPAAEGVAVGRAMRIHRRERERLSRRPGEERALRDAVLRVRRDLEQLVSALPPEEAELFEPELHILDEITPGLLSREAQGQAHEEAIFAETSCGCTDLVIDLRERLLGAVEGSPEVGVRAPPTHHEADLVLLTGVVTPSLVAFLPKQVVAVVAAMDPTKGVRRDVGRGSHAAILARGRGVPIAYAASDAWASIPDSAWLVVEVSENDARIRVEPGDDFVEEVQRRVEAEARERVAEREPLEHLGIALRVNVASAHDDIPAAADGIGLVRTEMMFAGGAAPPGEDEQVAALLRIAAKARGAPVVVRLFDAGGDKPLAWLGGEAGSARGIERLLAYPEALDAQLRALARARERADVRVLLPFAESAGQVQEVRRCASRGLPVGAMIETPRAVELVEAIAAAADFLSIGTNDLTATVLGVERTGSLPATDARVLSLVQRTIDAAHSAGREATICGEMAGDERGARLAVGLGADAISVAPARAPLVRRVLAQTSREACVAEAKAALAEAAP